MAERWQKYFDSNGAFDKSWLKTAVAHWGFHENLYGMIQRYCAVPAKILDVGCGPGWSDMYLASLGYRVVGVDNEPALIELANQQAQQLGAPATFKLADAFDLTEFYGQFDLAYSCGVLEHFDREITIQLLKEQAKCAKYVLIQIPTYYTSYTGAITDERMYSVRQLVKIVNDSGLNLVAKFGYGDVTHGWMHTNIRRLLPRFIWRILQNQGYAYSIAVVGKSIID